MLHCNHSFGPPSCWLSVAESGTWLGFKVTGVKSEPELKVAGSLEAPVGVKAPDLIEGCGRRGGGRGETHAVARKTIQYFRYFLAIARWPREDAQNSFHSSSVRKVTMCFEIDIRHLLTGHLLIKHLPSDTLAIRKVS